MAQFIMFLGALIILLSLFLVESKQSMPFFTPFSNFIVYDIHTILSYFLNIFF